MKSWLKGILYILLKNVEKDTKSSINVTILSRNVSESVKFYMNDFYIITNTLLNSFFTLRKNETFFGKTKIDKSLFMTCKVLTVNRVRVDSDPFITVLFYVRTI